MTSLTQTPAWQALLAQRAATREITLAERFARDAQRTTHYRVQAARMALDFSRQPLDDVTLQALFGLTHEAALGEWVAKLMRGERVNVTEGRAVLHTALRAPRDRAVLLDGTDVMPMVHAERARLLAFADEVRGGKARGTSGARITDVINLGIGGSDLGPAMVCAALEHLVDGPRCHFVSNVDGAHLALTLKKLDPASTLVIVSSKTFTTQETMANALAAKQWLARGVGEGGALTHFAAATANPDAAQKWGVDAARIFRFWDWVGGRYSLWSSIGLPIALAIGPSAFESLLEGAHDMDEHFASAPLERNLPVLLALTHLWLRNFCGAHTLAVIPYAQPLHLFSAYLQQLEMESNGKRVDRDGRPLDYDTAPIIWGTPGTNAQHSFFQMLHQGTTIVPVDFIATLKATTHKPDHHAMLLANLLAQANAFAFGSAGAAPSNDQSRAYPGNRPSNIVWLEHLDPPSLGALIALYEHKVYTQSVIWRINAFDQFGVELGKQLAARYHDAVAARLAAKPTLEGEPWEIR